MPANAPGEAGIGQLVRGGLALRDHLPVLGRRSERVGRLHQPAAVDLTQRETDLVGPWPLQHPCVAPFRLEALHHAVLIAGRDDQIGLGRCLDALDRIEVDDLVERHDPAESRAGVAVVGPLVHVGKIVASRGAARIGVLHDHHRRGTLGLAEIVHDPPRRISVEVVQVAERQPAVLVGVVPPGRLAGRPVAGAEMVRVLAVAAFVHPFQRQVHGRRQGSGLGRFAGPRHTRGVACGRLVQPVHDRRVIGSRMGEGGPRQPPPRGGAQPTSTRLARRARFGQFLQHRLVVGRVHHHAHAAAFVAVILRSSPHHRRPADVDQLGPRVGPERVQVAHHQIDGRNAVLGQRRQVRRLRPVSQDPAVDARVQRLHPAIQHLGTAGDVLHRQHRHACLGQRRGRPAARDDLPPEARQPGREVDHARLVPHRDQRPHRVCPSCLHSSSTSRRPVASSPAQRSRNAVIVAG